MPSRGAAEELRRTLEHSCCWRPAGGRDRPRSSRCPIWSRAMSSTPACASGSWRTGAADGFEREVLLRRSAHAAQAAGAQPPFNLRPGLIGEILALYDDLRRRHKSVAHFDRLMTGSLESSARLRSRRGAVAGSRPVS